MSAIVQISNTLLWGLALSTAYLVVRGQNKAPMVPPSETGLPLGVTFPFERFPSVPTLTAEKTIVLMMAASCLPCKTLLQLVPRWLTKNPQVQVVGFMVGTPDEVSNILSEFQISFPVHPIGADLVKHSEISIMPFAFLVRSNGIIVAKNGVNTDVHLDDLIRGV